MLPEMRGLRVYKNKDGRRRYASLHRQASSSGLKLRSVNDGAKDRGGSDIDPQSMLRMNKRMPFLSDFGKLL